MNPRARRLSHLASLAILVTYLAIELIGCSSPVGEEPTPQFNPSIVATSTGYATWESLLRTAQREAEKFGPDYVPMQVTSILRKCELGPEPPIVQFIFVAATGKRLNISVRASDLPTIAFTDPEYDEVSPAPKQEVLKQYSEIASSVRLSPYEACLQNRAELEGHKGEDSVIAIDMYLGDVDDPDRRPKLPVVWELTSTNREGLHLRLSVSPETGEVLSRNFYQGTEGRKAP